MSVYQVFRRLHPFSLVSTFESNLSQSSQPFTIIWVVSLPNTRAKFSQLTAKVRIKLCLVFSRVVKLPEVRERLSALGVDPTSSTPEEFRSLIAADITKWTAVAKAANIKAD